MPTPTKNMDKNSITHEFPRDEQHLIKEKIRELVRHASLTRLIIHADCTEVGISEPGPGFRPGKMLASNMAFILVSGDALRLTFKVHFNTRTAKTLAFRIFGGEASEDITERQAIDYFKEYANLVAGSVISLLGQTGVDLGISLPLCTRGFNEIFSDYSIENRLIPTDYDFWSLRVNGLEFYCSSFFELMNTPRLSRALEDLSLSETFIEEDGELDFL